MGANKGRETLLVPHLLCGVVRPVWLISASRTLTVALTSSWHGVVCVRLLHRILRAQSRLLDHIFDIATQPMKHLGTGMMLTPRLAPISGSAAVSTVHAKRPQRFLQRPLSKASVAEPAGGFACHRNNITSP